MKAAAIDRFGPPSVLKLHTLPVPDAGPGEVLIALHAAGVGVWDADIRGGHGVGMPTVLYAPAGAEGAPGGRAVSASERAEADVVVASFAELAEKVMGPSR